MYTEEKSVKEIANEIYSDHYRLISKDLVINKYDAHVLAISHSSVTVEYIMKSTPMYTGNLNPIWKLWNDVKKELTNRR